MEETPGAEPAQLFPVPAGLVQPQQVWCNHSLLTSTFLAGLPTQRAAPLPEHKPTQLHTLLSKVLIHLQTQS